MEEEVCQNQTGPAALFLSYNFLRMMSLFIRKGKKRKKEKCVCASGSSARGGARRWRDVEMKIFKTKKRRKKTKDKNEKRME